MRAYDALTLSQRIGVRLSSLDAVGEAQRPQTTAAAERGRAGGCMWVPQLPLHRVHTSAGAQSSRFVVVVDDDDDDDDDDVDRENNHRDALFLHSQGCNY